MPHRITATIIAAVLLTPLIFIIKGSSKDDQTTTWLPTKTCLRELAPPLYPELAPNEKIMLLEGEGNHKNMVITPKAPPPPKIEQPKKPKDPDYSNAIKLMRQGKIEKASTLLQQYLTVKPEHSEAWRQLGDCQYNLGVVDKALNSYRIALRKDNRNYLAERGRGIASLYMGYDHFSKGEKHLAHTHFQTALNSLHSCLRANNADKLAQYGQALAAEGASRKLYNIATKALGGKNHEQAKEIIRNCLDIIDVAVSATNSRIKIKPQDAEAKMLLGCLLIRRAKVLQPFGHNQEAMQNINDAIKAFKPLTISQNKHSQIAQAQVSMCQNLIKKWNE